MIENTWIKVDDLLAEIAALKRERLTVNHRRDSPYAYRQEGEIAMLDSVTRIIYEAPVRRSYLVPRDLTPEDFLEPDSSLAFPATTDFLDLSGDEPEPDVEMGIQERRRARRTPRVRDDDV